MNASQCNLATMQYKLTLLYWPGLIHVVTEVAQGKTLHSHKEL